MTKSITYSEARANLAKIWDEIIDTNVPMKLIRRGKDALAVLPADELEVLLESVHLMKSPKNAQRILKGIEDAENKRYASKSITELEQDLNL